MSPTNPLYFHLEQVPVKFSFATALLLLLLPGLLWLYNQVTPIDQRIGVFGENKWKLPPGPKGVPLLGNLPLFVGDVDSRKLFASLGVHGEMTTLRLGARTWIVLNSHRVAYEFITKYGALTADREPWPVAGGIVGRGMLSILMPFKEWQSPRRAMHHLLSGSAVKQYSQWQELESTQLLDEYVSRPERWYAHHYRYANAVVVRIALGQRAEKSEEELRSLQKTVTAAINQIGYSWIDWFPALARLPRWTQWWRQAWEELSQEQNELLHAWWDPVVASINAGTAPPSWAKDVLLNPGSDYQGNAEEAMYTAMILIGAGSDTTREALNVFVMAISQHPEEFANLRAEVDALCETNSGLRLPVMDDMKNLPFTCATVKEVLRWRPLFPGGAQHTLSKDIEFEGYRFPAGVSFVVNGVAVENDCEDPGTFKPQRWLDGNEMNVAHGIWQFGGGRRICPGYRLAQTGLFLNFARLAMCFEFEARGELDPECLNHHTTEEPFPIKVTSRGEKYSQLIETEAGRAGLLG